MKDLNIIKATVIRERKNIMKEKKFLNGLKNCKDTDQAVEILDKFISNELELSYTDLNEFINIVVENRVVLKVLEYWNKEKDLINEKRREFFSKQIQTMLKNKDVIDNITLINIYKIYNIIYLSLLRRDTKKKEVFLYHANSVITSLGFITSRKLFSRKYGEDTGLPQTYQKSDEVDKQKDIFNDIFFDNCDIGKNTLCSYGPITFVFKAEEILSLGKEIKVTKDNPIYDSDEYMYFSSLSKIQNKMISYRNGEDDGHPFYTRFKHHTTVRNCDYIEITKNNLECIIIENDGNVDELKQYINAKKCYSSEKLKEIIECALEKANLKEVKVKVRGNRNKKNSFRSRKDNSYSTSIEELWSSNLGVLYSKK